MLQRWSVGPDKPRGLTLVPPIPAPPTAEMPQKQYWKDQRLQCQEEVPWSSGFNQPDPEFIVKEEEDKLWISQEGELLNPVKTEDGEEQPQSSQCHQIKETQTSRSAMHIKMESDEEDCGGPEPTRSTPPHMFGNASDSSETDVSDGDSWQKSEYGPETEDADNGWKEIRTCESTAKNKLGCSVPKKTLSCSECGKQFSRKYNLDRHVKLHGQKRTFLCRDCGEEFTQKRRLLMHMIVHRKEKSSACEFCGKDFHKIVELKKHMRAHKGEKMFSCGDCGKRFNHKTHLRRHMIVHTGEMPFKCDVCGKKFRRMSEVKTHTRVHTGEKPYICADCGKRFSQSSNLKTHIRVHTGERPFKCGVCGKTFRRMIDCNTHMRVHTGEKPYICGECGKRFSQNSNLNMHVLTHAAVKPSGNA